jgi:hypothetical protein
VSLRKTLLLVFVCAAMAPSDALGWHQPASAPPPIQAADVAFYNKGSSCYRQLEAKIAAGARAYGQRRFVRSLRILREARALADRCIQSVQNFPTATPTAACVKPTLVQAFRQFRTAIWNFRAGVAAHAAGREGAASRRIEAGLIAQGRARQNMTRTDRQLRGQEACN